MRESDVEDQWSYLFIIGFVCRIFGEGFFFFSLVPHWHAGIFQKGLPLLYI